MREIDREQVKRTWRILASSNRAFLSNRNVLVRRDLRRLAPPGWVAAVSISDAAVVVVPKNFDGSINNLTLARRPGSHIASPEGASEAFGPLAEHIGPTIWGYGRGPLDSSARKNSTVKVRGPVRPTHPLAQELMCRIRQQDRDVSRIDEVDSGLFLAIDSAGSPMSMAGYRRVTQRMAHMSVATANGAQQQGFGHAASAAALRHAASVGLLGQWRCNETDVAAIALAESLGMDFLGRQISFRVNHET